MFSGFLINEVFLALNISRPLTSIPLVISLSTITLALSAVAYCRHELTSKINIDLGILKNAGSKIILLVPLILGAFGSLFTNVYVTSAMLISIILLFGLAVFSKRFSSRVSLQAVLFFVSLALAIQVLFTSKYILGFDANGEFYVFKLTSGSGHWTLLSTTTDSVPAVNLSSMLSVTILPTVYYSLMNCSGELVFRVFIRSCSPLFRLSYLPYILSVLAKQQRS